MSLVVYLFWAFFLLVVYVYIGYPVLISILASLLPLHRNYVELFPKVTILIPAYNEEKFIEEKISNTLSLDYPRDKLQILVVSDGSSDKTPEIAASYCNKGIEAIFIPERNGKMAAIVRAMKFCRGEIIVFSDANNMYDNSAIRELVLPFSDPTVGATTGAKLIIDDGRDLSAAEGLYWKYESQIKINESKIDSCVSSVGEILAIRSSVYFTPKEKIVNDDHYIILDLLRRGYRLVYTPKARSYEHVSQTAADEFTRRRRMNAGLYQTISMSSTLLPLNRPLLLWEIISHKYLRVFVPFAMILCFGINFALFVEDYSNNVRASIYIIAFITQIAFYSMAVIGNVIKFQGLAGKIFYLPAFLVNSNFAILAGLYTFLTDNQPHIWKQARR